MCLKSNDLCCLECRHGDVRDTIAYHSCCHYDPRSRSTDYSQRTSMMFEYSFSAVDSLEGPLLVVSLLGVDFLYFTRVSRSGLVLQTGRG